MSRYVARDIRSVTGKNLQHIHEITGLNPWSTRYELFRTTLIDDDNVVIPPEEQWRLPYLVSLLGQKRAAQMYEQSDNIERLDELINSLVIN